jgi:hypothetical protein
MAQMCSLPSLTFQPRRSSTTGPGPWSGHLPFACDLVTAARPALLVELGTYYGESYFGFCQALYDHRISCQCYAVDTWTGDPQGGFYGDEILASVEAHNREYYAAYSTLLRMPFDEALDRFENDSIDILHIDGLHSYEAVRHDFETWLPKVRNGGLVFAHSAGLGVLVKPGGNPPPLVSKLLHPVEAAAAAQYYEALSARLQDRFYRTELLKRVVPRGRCAVQMFFRTRGPYCEANSITHVIESDEWRRLNFEVPLQALAFPLRLDPADRPAMIEISEISILRKNSPELLWGWRSGDVAPAFTAAEDLRVISTRGGIMVVSIGVDPQLYLPLSVRMSGCETVTVSINIRTSCCVDVYSTAPGSCDTLQR